MKGNIYVKIAYWYYTLGMTQDEIAKRLSFTRQKVNQIISSLPDLDVVSINIHGYERDNVELECRMEQRFDLRQVIVASDYGDSSTAIYKVTNVAAQYMDENIQQGNVIGVSWGNTLAMLVDQMSYKTRNECRVVQLMGAQNIERRVEKADEIVRGLANKLNCPSYMLYAPVVVEHAETKKWLLKERSIKASYELMRNCDIAILGVGELSEDSTMCASGHITVSDVRTLRGKGFVGDIAMNPVRKDGTWNDCPLTERLLNADMECLKEIKNTVLVASGEKKVEAIQAVLCSRCIDTLIIDETTAQQVMDRF